MLSPDVGVTLLEALAPPDGYQLDAAVGTTFTLDLVALLAVPTAFSLAPAVGHDDETDQTPLGLLEALRAHAARITLFCDSAHISLPDTSAGSALSFLDEAVVPVQAPRGGYFHPKIWIVRFRGHNDALTHRVLIPSRNLTFDRSHDTLVRLDEALPSENVSTAALPELTKLLKALPTLALASGPAPSRLADVTDLAKSVSTARFALPEGFDDMRIHLLGFTTAATKSPLPAEAARSLVVSPFLGEKLPDALPRTKGSLTIVSRPAALDRAFSTIAESDRPAAYVLHPGVTDDSDGQKSAADDGSHSNDDTDGSGLHAKLFVHDLAHKRTAVFSGSANATQAAFNRNTEVLIELGGLTRSVGVEQFLKKSDEAARKSEVHDSLMSILVPHSWSEPADDESAEEAELARLRYCLGSLIVTADVREIVSEESSDDQMALYETVYSASTSIDIPANVKLDVRPITDSRWHAAESGEINLTVQLPIHRLTRFLGVRIRLGDMTASFVLAADMRGAPEDRTDRLLSHLIASPERLIRYLVMLLSDLPEDRFGGELSDIFDRLTRPGTDLRTVPLLELMLRALVTSPQRLHEVDRLMALVAEDENLADKDLLDLWASVSKLMGSKK